MPDRQHSGSTGLGQVVRSRRLALGLTQHELALRLGSSDMYVTMIERGAKQWPRKYVPALSRELGVSEVDMAIAAGLISDPALEVSAA